MFKTDDEEREPTIIKPEHHQHLSKDVDLAVTTQEHQADPVIPNGIVR